MTITLCCLSGPLGPDKFEWDDGGPDLARWHALYEAARQDGQDMREAMATANNAELKRDAAVLAAQTAATE
jgi:hypothetical protein